MSPKMGFFGDRHWTGLALSACSLPCSEIQDCQWWKCRSRRSRRPRAPRRRTRSSIQHNSRGSLLPLSCSRWHIRHQQGWLLLISLAVLRSRPSKLCLYEKILFARLGIVELPKSLSLRFQQTHWIFSFLIFVWISGFACREKTPRKPCLRKIHRR